MRIKNKLAVILSGVLLLNLLGCESLARKFTRKPKHGAAPVEMVLVPEEYKPNVNKEEAYRQYYLYWGTWLDELINVLDQNASQKKKVDCAQEALKNLVNMKMMLVEPAQKNFDRQIGNMNSLLAELKADVYGQSNARFLRLAAKIKSAVHKDFAYSKIRNYLK